MLPDATSARLFAQCPLWLWPVLALSLCALALEMRRLEARGCLGVEIRLTAWGVARISKAWWPDAPPDWRDALYRAAMGEPVPDPAPDRRALGIITDETQVDWILGLVGRAHARDTRRRSIPLGDGPDVAHGGYPFGGPALQARAPPFEPSPEFTPEHRPGSRLGGQTCWRRRSTPYSSSCGTPTAWKPASTCITSPAMDWPRSDSR